MSYWKLDKDISDYYFKSYEFNHDLISVRCNMDDEDNWHIDVTSNGMGMFSFKHISKWNEKAIFNQVFKQISENKKYTSAIFKRLFK